jgi:S-DNA-T family DNA segregation ATPase FtsK/SpoIIIE
MTAVAAFGDDDEPVPVDMAPRRSFDAEVVGDRVHERVPVVPDYLRDRATFKLWARFRAQQLAWALWFHLAHVHVYGARLALWSPAGVYRSARWVIGWVFDAEAATARQDAVKRCATTEYLSLTRQRNERVKRRGIVAGAGSLLLTAGVWTFTTMSPLLWQILACTVVVLLLGKAGAPGDRRVMDLAHTTRFDAQPLTADQLTTALRALGIPGMTPKNRTITYPSPIRDMSGRGWLASVDLPTGITAGQVADKRDQLASGLRRPLGCVWPSSDAEAHAGRLELVVLRVPMSQAKPVPHPLLRSGTADIFTSLPLGVDQRGRPVAVPLIESNLLVGSLPGGGKTASLRCVLAGCALDKRVELRIHELKGSGDLESFERIAHRYGSGVDDRTIEACLSDLRELLAELERRAAQLKALRATARDLVPDSKVTPTLAERRSLGLHPIVFVADEIQELFGHETFGKEAGQLATTLIKRGRALGLILIMATQRPDKDSLPTGVSANAGIRLCLRVMSQVENDLILGTSAYRNGIRATLLTRSDRGVGYLVGATDQATVVRCHYLDAAATDSIVARAYLARQAGGLLTGHAAGEATTATGPDLLADCRTVFALVGGKRLWHAEMLERLVELRPVTYAEWDVRRLGVELRDRGVPTVQVATEDDNGTRVNRRGIRLDDLDQALDEGDRRPEIEE